MWKVNVQQTLAVTFVFQQCWYWRMCSTVAERGKRASKITTRYKTRALTKGTTKTQQRWQYARQKPQHLGKHAAIILYTILFFLHYYITYIWTQGEFPDDPIVLHTSGTIVFARILWLDPSFSDHKKKKKNSPFKFNFHNHWRRTNPTNRGQNKRPGRCVHHHMVSAGNSRCIHVLLTVASFS